MKQQALKKNRSNKETTMRFNAKETIKMLMQAVHCKKCIFMTGHEYIAIAFKGDDSRTYPLMYCKPNQFNEANVAFKIDKSDKRSKWEKALHAIVDATTNGNSVFYATSTKNDAYLDKDSYLDKELIEVAKPYETLEQLLIRLDLN